MTIDVLVVEDEPAARRYVSSVIEQQCPGFTVVAVAEHGEEALEILSTTRIDLVVTDARMPVLDGIGLICEMRRREMDEPVLVLSGFDDFEYVRGALTSGAVDYVLKPAGAQRMRMALDGIVPHIRDRIRRRLARRLAQTVVRATDGTENDTDLPAPHHLAVIREGGLLQQTAQSTGARQSDVGPESYHVVNSLLIVPGRDDREILCVAPAAGEDSIDTPRFRAEVGDVLAARLEAIPFLRSSEWGTRTVGFAQRPSSRLEMRRRFLQLTASINRAIYPGRMVEVGEADVDPTEEGSPAGLTAAEIERLRVAAAVDNLTLMGTVVDELRARWSANSSSLYEIRDAVERVLRIVKHPGALETADQVCADPPDIDRIAVILREELQLDQSDTQEPGFFQAIREHVDEHYREYLSLTDVAKHFRLSPSHVGKLFRKHQKMSFGKYVTARRIGLARDLLSHDLDAPVKEIAATCGFDDQFYFSRVFKAHTGVSPTEFRRSTENSF